MILQPASDRGRLSGKGTYILVLRAERRTTITVGRLGRLAVKRGYYLYVGSALGPGGLGARIAHHAGSAARPHWHIDYLRRAARPVEVWFTLSGKKMEHEWARALFACPSLEAALKGFGASDSGSVTHLFFSKDKPSLDAIPENLARDDSIEKMILGRSRRGG